VVSLVYGLFVELNSSLSRYSQTALPASNQDTSNWRKYFPHRCSIWCGGHGMGWCGVDLCGSTIGCCATYRHC